MGLFASRLTRISASGLVLGSLAGCQCGEEPPPPAPRVLIERPIAPIISSRPVATRAAFDFVASTGGAVLAWGAPARFGGGVRAQLVDALGGARGTDVDVATRGIAHGGAAEQVPSQIDELSMAVAGSRVGVGWVVTPVDTTRAQVTVSNHDLEGFAAPQTLETVSRVDEPRGRISVSATQDGQLMFAHRIGDAPCVSVEGTCARIATVNAETGHSMRGDQLMEVRGPCPSLLFGGVTRGPTWYYGICAADPITTGTVYAIRPETSYAAATTLEPGCRPASIVATSAAVYGVSRCDGGPVAVRQLDENGAVTAVARDTPIVDCTEERPTLRVGGIALPLRESVSGIAALLPGTVAPADARAVWTGEAVLVAVAEVGSLGLRRYQCQEGVLTRTDLP